MRRVAIVCPGRGSYTEASLGSLDAADALVREAEALRAGYELEPLLELDGARKFEPARHLRPANVSPLIYLVSVLDARRAAEEGRVVCVLGNSMGWYTALAVAGALSFADGFRLVQEMSLLQEEGEPGGQVIYPLVDEQWHADRGLQHSVAEALAEPGLHPSIRLGGYAVLAGDERAVARCLRALPRLKLGKTGYPFRLAQHGPYHTPLASGVAAAARQSLAGLVFRTPSTTLVDGRGVRHGPLTASVQALRDYTLGAQIDTPYDFTTSVRVALRELAPDALVLPGPGNSLGGVCGQVLVAEGWRGIDSRAAFEHAQAGEAPPLVSMRR